MGIQLRELAVSELDATKKSYKAICFSALNPKLVFCYNHARVIEWGLAVLALPLAKAGAEFFAVCPAPEIVAERFSPA